MNKAHLALIFRVLHWSVALIVLLNSFVLEQGDMAHRYLGYTALSVVLFRILISNKKKVTYYNPKAKYVYWSIWACIFSLATTGFMMGLDYFWGSQRLEDIHNVISNILLGLVFIHLCGVFLDAWINKRKTWMVMITGRKES